MVVVPRPYQLSAVGSVSDRWRTGQKRVLLVSPTGSGKTTIAAEIVHRTVGRGKRVLILAHRRRLIQQIAERLGIYGIRYGIIMADLPNADWVKDDAGAPVQIASRDTLLAHVGRYGWSDLPSADLLILDEAHNVESAIYTKLAEACNVHYWIGLTATPCRPDGSGLGRKNWDVIVEAATVPELVTAGFLVPVKCFAPPGIGERRKRGDKTPIAGDPVDHWQRYAAGMPTVAFTRTVAESLAVRDRYRAAGIAAEHIDADTPHDERERIIASVESGDTLILTNASVLVEGVDIPILACCQILSRCGSYIRLMQALGRVMRIYPGKTHAVLLDHSGAVFDHGMPGEPIEWSLSEDDNLDARLKKDRKDGKRAEPSCCSRCGCYFAGAPVCPECGTPLPRRQKKEDPSLSNERLVQVAGDPAEAATQRQRFWNKTIHQGKYLNWTSGRCVAIFKKKFGMYPRDAGVSPVFDFNDRYTLVAELMDGAAIY